MKTCSFRFSIPLFAFFVVFVVPITSYAIQGVGVPEANTIPEQVSLELELQRGEAKIALLKSGLVNQEVSIAKTQQALDFMKAKQKDLLDTQDKLSVSSASFDDVIRLLQTQKVELTVALAGLEARREVLQQIFEESKMAQAENASKLGLLLSRLVKMQTEDVKRAQLLYEKGATSSNDLQKFKAKLLETEIRYAQLMESGDENEDSSLKSQLTHISLDRAETKARLATTNQLLADYTSARPLIKEAHSLDNKFLKMEDQLAAENARLSQLQDHLVLEIQEQDRRQIVLEQMRADAQKNADDRKD